jgi:hypothetical protein
MAWDRHRNIVGCAGSCNGPNSLWCADLARKFGVGNRLANRYFPQSAPHFLLKSRPADVEWQFEVVAGSFDEANDASD